MCRRGCAHLLPQTEKILNCRQYQCGDCNGARGSGLHFLDHDDLLAPDAPYETVRLILRGPKDDTGVAATGFRKAGAQYDMIYTDEDKVDMDGKTHFQPHFKPDINIDLLRSNNYITHFTMMRKTLLEKAGMIREEYDGAQDYDLFLRCVSAQRPSDMCHGAHHWRCHTESTSENPFSKQYAVDAGRRAIEDHLKRQGPRGSDGDKGYGLLHGALPPQR